MLSNPTLDSPYVYMRDNVPVIRLRWSWQRKMKFLRGFLIGFAISCLALYAYSEWSPWFDARWQRISLFKPAVKVTPPVDSALHQQTVLWVKRNAKRPITDAFAKMVVDETFTNAAKNSVDPFVMLAIMRVESEFDYTARSGAGAIGLTQVIPKWPLDKMPNPAHVYDPKNNIRVGTEVLAEYLDWYNGDMRKALLQYNGSLNIPGSAYSKKVMAARSSLLQWLDRQQDS